MNNGLSKEEQISNGLLTKRKGDSCEMIAQAYFRNLGWLVYPKFSGPIDIVLIHEKTGEVRFIDVKHKNTRQGTKTAGRRINRIINSSLKKILKIEIVYVDDEGKIEFSYSKGKKKWHEEHKIARGANGQYTGEVVKK
jgi:hypothetical protein